MNNKQELLEWLEDQIKDKRRSIEDNIKTAQVYFRINDEYKEDIALLEQLKELIK